MKMNIVQPKTYGREVGMPEKNEKYYPNFSISLKNFPEAKNWEVGKTYNLQLKVRQSEIEQRKDNDGRVSFEILAIGGEAVVTPKKPVVKPKYYPRA